MPDSIPSNAKPEEAATVASNGHRPPSLDFRRQGELDWSKIESEIHSIAMRAMAVEMVGRTAQDAIHGESLCDVFGFLSDDIAGDIARLKELLGLGRCGKDKKVQP
jgi:hypothetical protein